MEQGEKERDHDLQKRSNSSYNIFVTIKLDNTFQNI